MKITIPVEENPKVLCAVPYLLVRTGCCKDHGYSLYSTPAHSLVVEVNEKKYLVRSSDVVRAVIGTMIAEKRE